MGIPDNSLLDLIDKVKSWISWKTSDITSSNSKFEMGENGRKTCSECDFDFTDTCREYNCYRCGRMLCAKCVLGFASPEITAHPELNFICCKFCWEIKIRNERNRRFSDKIYPADSPRQSPEPPSPCFNGERSDGYSPHAVTGSSVTSYTGHPSRASAHCSPIRSDEEEAEDSSRTFFSPSSEFYYDNSGVDSSNISARHNFHSFTSVGSSPSDSPSRIRVSTDRCVHSVQKEPGGTPRAQKDGPADQNGLAVSRRLHKGCEDSVYADYCPDNLSIFRDQCEKAQKPLDFENNSLLWFPPPPNHEGDDMESNFFTYDDEDDEIGDSGSMFSSSSSLPSLFPSKEKSNEEHKGPMRAVIHGHFRALVSQLLQGEDIKFGKGSSAEDWLEIITDIACQAADCIRPDTSRGGSMDPVDYVKVKCVASGSPHESTFVKGVICTKNVKHKRMTSQYKNPRLLLLGGALEYQKLPNQLSSFQTLLQQEIDHLKLIVSRIEERRPNVLIVEKSVSSYAQEFLLEKEISLVLNVKRPLLERIARCTGALITPSVDSISTTCLGHCELFKLEKVSEDLEKANQFNKKPLKTLMFFEGCPKRLGCTVLLKGSSREELKKIKRVVQFAVFAAYHLSLETSFLADEGASLPKITTKPSISIPEKEAVENSISIIPDSGSPVIHLLNIDEQFVAEKCADVEHDLAEQKLAIEHLGTVENLTTSLAECQLIDIGDNAQQDLMQTAADEVRDSRETETLRDQYSVADGHPSLLVSFSSRCVLKGTVCELLRLLRITFYGCFDKPLGRYLRDDLFDQTSRCRSCKEPTEAHVLCFSHQKGNLTINVRRLPSVKLPGEQDGKIWMWHRCLKCPRVDGVPPASPRVVMSDAAWGLSFGKFLELSLSNNATANRVASCGHSLQKDCLRYYGFGSMVAFFRYSPIDILSVHLPPSVLDFSGYLQQEWIRKEAAELLSKTEALYAELLAVLDSIEQRSMPSEHEYSDVCELHDHIMDLKDQLVQEGSDYKDLLLPLGEYATPDTSVDILELNCLRRSLIISSHVWDRRFYSLDSLLKARSLDSKSTYGAVSSSEMNGSSGDLCSQDSSIYHSAEESTRDSKSQPEQKDVPNLLPSECIFTGNPSLSLCQEHKLEGLDSNLSDKIDSAWTGTDLHPSVGSHFSISETDTPNLAPIRHISPMENPAFKRLRSPARIYSLDSALRRRDRIRKGLTPSLLQLSTLRSFHASGEYRSMVRDPVSNVQRSFLQILPGEAQKLNILLNTTPSFISSASLLPEGARFPQTGLSDLVIAVYDNEPTSIISYALSSREYANWIADRPSGQEGNFSRENSGASIYSTWQSFGSLDLGLINSGSYGPEDAPSTVNSLFVEPKNSPHIRIAFEDESLIGGGKVKFSCTCYFAKQFEALRKKCCPSNVDFVRSLSRCKGWSAQGGKSNVYFAKSLDDRFIIKQVQKTELDSFGEFAPEYFKYLTESLSTKCPTSLAKVLGIYQVTVKHLKGGKETKMDLMVMENLFFRRNISRVYDLKGSARSRYNADPSGTDKVLLDMNLLETLRTKPIFLGSKAKRSLERAVWNDTAFLASVDVMDYSLLVGVDDERNELVLGIIDYMRQYTWDKHLETWVKATGILGGLKNTSPTIISPQKYKKRFRKAMTTYFLTVPDQWPS